VVNAIVLGLLGLSLLLGLAHGTEDEGVLWVRFGSAAASPFLCLIGAAGVQKGESPKQAGGGSA